MMTPLSLLSAPPAIVWRPFFPPVAIGVAVGLVLLLSVWQYARESSPWRWRAPLLSLRAVALALAAWVLMGPSEYPQAAATTPADLGSCLLATDVSGSMQTDDMAGPDGRPETRLTHALREWEPGKARDALRGMVRLDTICLGETAFQGAPASAAPAAASPLDRMLSGQLAQLPANAGACVVLVSDGRESEDANAPFARTAALAREKKIPVHTVCVGTRRLARDVAVEVAPRSPYLIAGEPGELLVRVSQTGADDERTKVRVTGPEDFLFEREVAFEGRPEASFTVPVRHAAKGSYAYAAQAMPLAREAEVRNNRQECFVEATDRRLRVLLLEGQPHWDTKFLAQSLRKDEGVALYEVLCVGDRPPVLLSSRAEQGMTPGIPPDEEGFSRFDVVILGAQVERLLSPEDADNLARAVAKRGIRVMLSRGVPAGSAGLPASRAVATALSPLEPVVWSGADAPTGPLAPEPAQADHGLIACVAPGAWAHLPAPSHVDGVLREKEAALVVARAGTAPFLVTMPCESGQVAAVCGEGLWRTSMAAAKHKELAGIHDRFWSDAVRLLAMGSGFKPGEDLSLRLSRRALACGETLHIDVSARRGEALQGVALTLAPLEQDAAQPAAPQAVALAPADAGQLRLRAQAAPAKPGSYVLRLSRPGRPEMEAKFTVSGVDRERLRADADPAAMRRLSEATGGQTLDGKTPQALATFLAAEREARQIPPQAEYVWNSLYLLFLILLLPGAEWLLRRKGGLA